MFKTIANSRSSWIHRLLRNIIRVTKCFFINSFSISWEFHSYHIDLGLEKYRMTGMEKLKLNLLRSYTSRTARLFKAAKLHINKHIVFEKLRIFYYVAHKNYLFQNGFPNWLTVLKYYCNIYQHYQNVSKPLSMQHHLNLPKSKRKLFICFQFSLLTMGQIICRLTCHHTEIHKT